ncbi:MAG: hypothetical protein JW925_12135 [Syntrophaceae bacterium]|nr:hypothetical protein [Syntrophaceae bacterium]
MNRTGLEKKDDFSNHEEDKNNEISAMFLSQQQRNMAVKDAMFQELAKMALPEHIIKNILHLEDEPPF